MPDNLIFISGKYLCARHAASDGVQFAEVASRDICAHQVPGEVSKFKLRRRGYSVRVRDHAQRSVSPWSINANLAARSL